MPSVTLRKTLAVAVLSGSLCALPLATYAAGTAKPTPAHQAAKVAPKKVHHKVVANPTVKKVQEALNKDGAKLKVDGIMGHRTRLALKGFQKSHKMKSSGKLDKATLKALLKG